MGATADPRHFEAARTYREQDIHYHKGSYIAQGVLFLVFGALAAVLPGVAAFSVELMVGALLLVSGVFQFFLSMKARIHWWALASGTLSVVVGIFMLWAPLAGLLALVTLVAIFLALEGFFELFLASQWRPAGNWGWMAFSGVVALVLAAFLWFGWPGLGVLYIGWMVAINLFLYGIALLMMATTASRSAS